MSVQSQLDRLSGAKAELRTVLQQNGTEVPASAKLDAYPAYLQQALQSGAAYLYKVSYPLDDWYDAGTYYSQQPMMTPVAGAPDVPPQQTLLSGVYLDDTIPDETLDEMAPGLEMLNRAKKFILPVGDQPVACQLQCMTRGKVKPVTDLEVYLLAK